MFLTSDNAGPAHPAVIEALAGANEGYAGAYGADAQMDAVRALVREAFEAPEAAVYLVATGTAANSLALATLSQPWQTVFCAPVAHIHEDECNAPEFFTGGAKLTLVGAAPKMTPQALERTIAAEESRGVHGPQRGPVSITNVTERGTVYTVDEIAALTGVARGYGLPVHLDGARFANALVAQGCTPAEMTWKAGVDAVSFGGTKNGLLGVEAVIFFDPAHAWEFELRRKRGAHLFSKHRYLAAQMLAYLTDDLWLDCARRANANAARLAEGLAGVPGADFLHQVEANMIFATLPRTTHERLFDAGAQYYLWNSTLEGAAPDAALAARLVCDWSLGAEAIERFIDIARG
jgi:threonine aldolase